MSDRLRIGVAHKRLGVEPKLYLSAVVTLQKVVSKVLIENIDDKEILAFTLETFDKLTCLDTTLIFDTYIGSLELKVAERTKQLQEQAMTDPLTNIYNRRAMHNFLKRELAVAKRAERKLSLVYFDVDKFKDVNDIEGHVKGDEVLMSIGKILLKTIRETDITCRYGGDEFCIILPQCDLEGAVLLCQKIIKTFSTQYPTISLSIGIAETGSEEFFDEPQLIKEADDRMYLAKEKAGSYVQT